MSTVAESFIKQRAQILAMVQFTSRSDLQAVNFPEGGQLDLLVRILSDRKGYHEYLGVILKGTTQLLSNEEEAARYLRPIVRRKPGKPVSKHGFPVIILVFSMPNDHGFYSWQIEPILDEKGPQLKFHEDLECSVFDRAALGRIVQRVSEWHDRLFALLGVA
jgi:hypothetical protein